MIKAIVTKIDSVAPYGDNLSINKVAGNQVISNRKSDGSFRWAEGEIAVYLFVNSVVPDDVLQERGYWDFERNRGLLDGGKHIRNRVKVRKMGPGPDKEETVGLLFKVTKEPDPFGKGPDVMVVTRGIHKMIVTEGSDVTEFFGITEHVPGDQPQPSVKYSEG